MGDGTRGRRGAVLVSTLLLLVAFTLLAQGALFLAQQELAASRVSAALLRARAAAESGLAAVARAGSVSLPPDVALGVAVPVASGPLTAARYSVTGLRLSREEWLLTARGQADPGSAEASTSMLAWLLDPVGRAVSVPAVVTVGPEGGVVMAGSATLRAHADDCPEWDASLDSLVGSRSIPPVAWARAAGPPNPLLGRLSLEEVVASVPVRLSGSGTPEPVEGRGRCVVDDPWNWGEPDADRQPCSLHRPARASLADIEALGGVGQGLLVARGNVVLRGTRFEGLILAGGRLVLREGAELRGAAWATGGATVDAASTVRASACAVTRALDASRSLWSRMVMVEGIGPGVAR